MSMIVWLEDLGKTDVAVAGGKGANLGELTNAGFPVPPGFVVTAQAYVASMDEGGVREQLAAPVVEPSAAAATEARQLVGKAGLPASIRSSLDAAYAELGRRLGVEDPPVAVRSSATAEDSADTSFAGMNRTITNVRGTAALAEAVVAAWASLFGERVLGYRSARGLAGEPQMAVVVQAMFRPSGQAWRSPPTPSRPTAVGS